MTGSFPFLLGNSLCLALNKYWEIFIKTYYKLLHVVWFSVVWDSFISSQPAAQYSKQQTVTRVQVGIKAILHLSDSLFQNARVAVRPEQLWHILHLCLAALFKKIFEAGQPSWEYHCICSSLWLSHGGKAQALYARYRMGLFSSPIHIKNNGCEVGTWRWWLWLSNRCGRNWMNSSSLPQACYPCPPSFPRADEARQLYWACKY